MVQQTTVSATVGDVPVTTTTTLPDTTTGGIDLTHEVSLGAQDSSDINVGLIIDRSGSTGGNSGSDLNGDGISDTFLQAQVAAAKELFQNYLDAGTDPSRVTITLLSYSDFGQVLGVYSLDDQDAFEAALDGLTPRGATNFADPLSDLNTSWTAQGVDPDASNNVVFLSDGIQNRGGNFADEVDALEGNFNAAISAIGVGQNSGLNSGSYGGLNAVDNTAGAVKVTNVSQLADIINTPPPIVDVDSVTATFTYEDPANPGETITITRTYAIDDPAISTTPNGYVLETGNIDLDPEPPAATDVSVEVVTTFNDGTQTLSTGTITVPFMICFTAGTLIATPRGEVAAGELRVGDLVTTHDHGPRPIKWIGSRKISSGVLASDSRTRPIRIRAGALGQGMPVRDLLVSPQHRVLVRSRVAARMFDVPEVLIAAKKLVGCPGIEVAEDLTDVTYIHLMFDSHELVVSDGALTESMFFGDTTTGGLTSEQVDELRHLFPELFTGDRVLLPVRAIPAGSRQKRLVARQIMNGKPLVEGPACEPEIKLAG